MDNSFSTQESQIVRRQSSLGGNNIKRTVTELEGNTALVWAKVTQVYYQKGTCDFTLLGGNTLLNDNSGSNGTYSAPIPVDYYGTNYQGKPFIKTRLVKEGNKVLVAFVDGKLANPVIVGVYPDNTEGYEYLAPAYTNKILDENEDTNNQVNNMLEVEPSNQIIYQSGNGDFAKSMQGKSFLIVQGSEQYALNDLLTNYDSLPYFYLDEESNDINSQKVPLYSVNEDAPEWLLVHESNNGTDTHRTRFYVNKKGELQIVFFDVNNPNELLVIDGSKDNGFTVNKRFDGDGNLDSDSKDYVKFNVGQDHKISMEVSSAKESKAQSQKLELKDDGLYYNGKSLLSYLDNIDSSVNDDDVKDIINSTTGVDNWDDFRDKVHQAAQDAQKAADEAKEAGDDADRAGEEAAQAGLDAKLAGENAAAKVDSMRDKLMYYLNLSPEKDLYVPGKYLILNEDVTIRSGFIKEGYIDDAAINSAAIKNAAITSAKIKDLAVYSAKIANAAITNAKISKLAVGTAQIRDLAVTDEKVGKLTFNHMIGEVLDANLIKVTNLEADSIKAHSITADKLFVGSLGEISGNLGNITGGHIDGSKVDIDGLPSDDPDMLTPEKKAQLRATVDTLQLAVNAQVDFQNSVGAPSNVCDTLKANMAKLVSDTTPLLRDMFSTEPYDHNLINTDIDNVNIELNNIQHRAITTIGKTANGKNTIYTGAFAPSNPQLGDIWAKPSTDGSNEGTFEIYGQSGWFSPTKDVYNRVQSQINNLPKSYYQSDQPTGNIVEGSMWYKPSYDALGNVTFTMYVYHNGAWKAMTDANIEGVNAAIHQVAQTADGKNKVFSSDTQPNSANVHEGDLWFNTKNNSIYVYHGGTWTVPNASAQAQIDSAISKLNNNYYQANQPTGNIKNGDMWYKTITNTNGQVSYELYVYQNGNWVSYNVDAINGLEQKINQVAQTADGKNAVFASGSAPSNPVQGDIWIDTSANNSIKVYINGSWQTTESQNQNVQDQVNNALNGIPKVYYQSTQPTGTINEGSTWYKTDNNNTYTMYTYKNGQWVGLLDDNINTAVDNSMSSLQKSGANLVINSDFSQGDYGWDLPSDGSAKVSDDLFKGHKYVTISKSNQSDTPFFWISQHNEFKVTPGEKLSYSAWIKHTGLNPNGALININWYADTTSTRNGWYSTWANSTNDSDWEFYKVEDITVPSNAQYARFAFTLPANGTVSYALPMLVHGSTVPNWSPSPLDSASVSDINNTNNNITSLQGSVNNINNQLEQQQNQINGVTTVNYVPNSNFVTDPQTGLAQTFQKPLLWKEFGNAQMRIADWGGQPAFMHFCNDYGAHSVRLDLDYADCIINGWVDSSTGDTKSVSDDVNGLINRLITVVPGDTLHLENDNVDQLSTGTNNVAWYDKGYNYLCTTNIPGMSKNSAYVQDVLVPYKACYAKIGMVGIPKGTKNTWGITYKFKNMAGSGTIISNNPTENSAHWTKVGSGSGTVTQVNNLSNAPRGTNSGMRLVTTWNNYQNTGMRTNLTGLTKGKVYMISFYAYATSGGGSIRMVTPDQSSIQIIPNTQSWYPIEFSFIASDTNQWLDLYTDAPNETITITCINISGCDSNADRLSDKVTGMTTLNNWGVQGSTVSVSDNQMLGENIIVLAPNGSTSNQMTYNNDLIENHVYVAKFWAKSDSGSNTLHMEMYGGHFDKDVNIPSGSNWTYVEFPFVYSSSTSTNTFRQNGSQRSFYLYNKGTASNVQVAGFGIYDYDSDVPKEGYYEDNRYGQIDASSAVYGATSAKDAYVRVWRNNTPSYYPATSRGTTVTEFDDTLKYVGQKAFDTYDTNNCTDLVNYLNGLDSTHIVAITTCDSNTLDSNFQKWLENHNVPFNLIQTYNQQRVRMAFVGPIDWTRSSWVFPTQFALEGNYTKYQPNTFGGTVSAHLRHNQTGSSKCYKFHTYPVTPKSWVEFTWRDTPDFDNVVFLNNGTGLIGNIGSNVPNLKTVSMYALDQEAFTLTGSSWANIGAYVEPFDIAPHVSTDTIPVVTSTHTSRVQASGSAAYSNQQAVYLEVGHDSTFDKSTKVLFNGAGQDNYSLQNYLVDGTSDGLGWAKPIRITYTPPVTGKAFNNNNSGIIYAYNTGTEMHPVVTANQMLTITQSSIDYIPAYQPNTSGLVNNSVQISQSYNGVTIDDKDGITINAGNNRISLNANVGIDIYGNRQHNMKLDTNGNLIMRGNLVAGNISGVTFSGNAMQLQTGLAINGNGAITVGNDVSINASQGLVMNKGSININNNTLITNDGTLITKKLLLNNSAQIINKESGRPVITLDNNGNATFAGNLNVVNINGNNGNLNGVLNVKGGIKSNGVYLSNSGLSISNGNVILGRDVTVLAAVGAADINGAIRSITGGWINSEGGWSESTQDCGFRIVPMRANHQIMIMLGAVPNLSRNQMAWYDSSQHFIRRDVNADFSQHKVSGSSTVYEYLYTPPSNAAYFSFSTYVGPNNVSQDVPIYIYEDGDVNLIMTNDGTLIAQNAIISGTVTSNNVNITGGHLHLMSGNNVGLDVDSNGNASFGGNLNAVNGSMNNMSLTGTLVVKGRISAANNNVQITPDGISIANGNLTLGNGNGTTFMALSDGTLTLNNASVTGQITATKLVVATKNDKNAVGINVNGNFTVDGLGEVYANNIHLKQGNNNTPTLEGVNVVGDGLKLGDTYWNAFYQNNMSRTNYTPNGLQTGYTLEGVYVQSRYRAHHGDGLQEHKNMSIVTQLAYKGYVDGYSGNEYDSDQDVRTGRIALLNPGQQFHLHLDGNAMPYFGKGGDRNIAFFDGSGNYIRGWKGTSNDITITSPSNARYVEISVAIGSGNVYNYFSIITGIHSNADQINMGNLTQIKTGWVDISRFRSAIMWEGNCNMGFPIISNNYGGQDISQFGTSKDNQWVTVLTLDTTGMRDGDVMVMKYIINYDNAHSEKGTTLYMSVNGKNQYDSERYMGSTNTKYAVVGEHHYVWYFTYHSDLGSQVIFNLNANKLYYGSRVYPTETLEFIHPVNNDYNGYGNFYGSDIGGAKNTSYTGAITTMSPSGELRQTYHDRQYSLGYNSNSMNAPNKVVYRDFQLYEGFLTMQTQKVGWSPTQHGTDKDDYSALYMSGSGIAFVGNPNRFSPEKWMYRYSGSEGVKAGGSVLSFWGEVSHEDLVENNFDMSLGTGITMDVFGNINAMVGSTDWRVRSFGGKPVLNISMNYGSSGFGSVLYSNIPGMGSGAYDNQDGSADAINLEEQGGHIVMGRLWLNTFGVDNYDDNSNNNVHFHLRSNNGWFFFHGETHGGPFVNDSQKELKYDIKPLSFKDSQDIIMNTDFAFFKYKEQNNRTDRGHMGVVIDHDDNGYSVDPRILSEDDKGVDIMSVVAALGTLVKQQQQQISELNMQVAYLESQLNK